MYREFNINEIVLIDSDALCDFRGCSGKVVRYSGQYTVVQFPGGLELAYNEFELDHYSSN